jgi:hypothetical protein
VVVGYSFDWSFIIGCAFANGRTLQAAFGDPPQLGLTPADSATEANWPKRKMAKLI